MWGVGCRCWGFKGEGGGWGLGGLEVRVEGFVL